MTDPVLPAAALARFTSAEARLYPMAMTDAVGYELATTLVGLVATELRRDCQDVESVLSSRDSLIDRLPQLAGEAGLELEGLAPDTVVDAASALRCRELGARAARIVGTS
jgi:hypothetical protein